MKSSSVSIARCASYDTQQVESAVRRSIDLLGGIERFVKPKSRVLIKPNLLSVRRPEEGVDTHPEVVRAVSRIIKTTASEILVGDSPGGWELRDVDNVYETSGMKKVCLQEGLRLVKFDKAVTMEGFPIAAIAKEVDAIISIPKLKSHVTTILTGAIKNTFGMVIGLSKAQCHLKAPMPDEFAAMLAKVFGLVKPALSVMDGIVGMEGDGPAAGALRNTGLIIASGDAVSLDAVFARLVGVEPFKVPLIREAARRGLGIGNLKEIEVLGERIENAAIKNFKMPKTSFAYALPGPLIKAALKRVKFYPYINKKECKRCGRCFDICPADTIEKFHDGSLWVNRKGCIHCFCCHEACDYKAITLKRSLLARIIIR